MQLSALIRSDYHLRKTEKHIYSVLPKHASIGSYDGRVKLYDIIVGSRIYNRLLWGASIDSYHKFVQRALTSSTAGFFLDAGSGSAVFTAKAYANTKRPLFLVDRSKEMLTAAQKRISKMTKKVIPDHFFFIQSDIFNLPFQKNIFSTVLCMGMLHLFNNAGELLNILRDYIKDGGQLYLTSLVTNRPLGARYLSLLHKKGEVAQPKSFKEVNSIINSIFKSAKIDSNLEGNMAYFVVSI